MPKLNLLHNVSLKPYNTFGINVNAKRFITVNSIDELREIFRKTNHVEKFILGGGSNILLTKDIDAIVIHNNLKGIKVLSKDLDSVVIEVAAGENWHDFVIWCLEHDYGGLENLSLIPGNVGTAPIQNIGAYGVELKDSFISCEALEISTNSIKTILKEDCHFEYRNSIFKDEKIGKYVITSVTFRLSSRNHKLKTEYGAISTALKSSNIDHPTIKDVSNAVIAIRKSKLPDPAQIGNSGSFFKNPIISESHFNDLKEYFPSIPSYSVSEGVVKVPAGWLIEKAGFKGKRFGNYGVHKDQALVLVNYYDAKGSDILELSQLIQSTILRLFRIKLETEVNIL